MNLKVHTIHTGNEAMAVSKLGQRRQVVIPKDIWERLGLEVGDYVEVEAERGRVVIKPKKLVDADLLLTPEEEILVKKGQEELQRGEYVTLEELDHELDDPALLKRSPNNSKDSPLIERN